jgi:hypothetical protein
LGKVRYILGAVLCALTAGSASASTIYNDLNSGNRGGLFIGNLGNENDWANEFLTPAGGALNLSDVIVDISEATGTGSITMFLYSNNAGVPGSSLATIATLTPTGTGVAPYTFTPGSPITLQASTQYWILMVDNSTGFFGTWYSESTETGTGVSGENHAEWTGSTWTQRANNTFTAETPEMEIDVTSAVPEPATFGMLGLACLMLAGKARRRKK